MVNNRESIFGKVPKDWKVENVGNVFELSQGLQISKSKRINERKRNFIPLLKIIDLPKGIFSEYVTNINETYIANKEDIIYTRTGIVGEVYTNYYGCVHNNCFKVKFDENIFDKNFVYYYLKSAQVKNYCRSVAGGSVQKDLTHGAFKSWDIGYPSLIEQTKIGTILKSLDDKIEVNTQMNRTLEEMAQAIFKEWFVEFNFPNEGGVPYKDNGGEMEESELGLIPRGWRVGTIGDILELPYGKALKKTERVSGEFPVVGSSGVVDYHEKAYVKGPGIVIGRKGTIGKVIFLEEDFFPIDTTFYVESKLGIENALYYLNYVLLKQDFQHISSDSAVPGLNRNQAYMNPIIQPSDERVEGFIEVVKPIFDKIQKNNAESKTLTETRDTLLPKLMSGELRV